MNPKYLFVTEGIELLTFFVAMPAIAIVIAYGAWRRVPQSLRRERYGILCVGSGLASVLLIVFAKWMNADVRTPQYFLQLVCFLLGCLLFGAFVGCGFSALLHLWHWHKSTRLM